MTTLQRPSASTARRREPSFGAGRSILSAGAAAGLLGGFVLAGVLMVRGWLSHDGSFWDPPMAVWALMAGIDHFGEPANHFWPILLGMLVHASVSAALGVVFAAVAFVLQLRGHLLVGLAFGLGVWVYMRYAILPLAVEGDPLFTSGVVAPQEVWWIAHALFGATLGTATDLWIRWTRPPPVVLRPSKRDLDEAA